ncbi:MAG: glycerol-3-phosphate dehydrogenase/oxidase [Planctomycetota bacterium]
MTTPTTDDHAFTREAQLAKLTAGELFDLFVVGGGATGLGVAVDAASRGYRVALCEQSDFGKGTSSRSTKLVHGGVRYLEQGHVGLVRSALYERGLLRQNAPHLVARLPTIVPLYRWWEPFYYRIGLAVYDLLAGRLGFGRSHRLSRAATLQRLSNLNGDGLTGGVCYFDGVFDDTRLLIDLAQTAVQHGAACANYTRVDGFLYDGPKIIGAKVTDLESGAMHTVQAKVVVNAAGPFGDAVRTLSDPDADPWIQPSQGTHIVLDRSFMRSDAAMIIPKTSDGRVVFAVPWHDRLLVGTTDTARDDTPLEPQPLASEIDFLLETVAEYLTNKPTRDDIQSVFAGLRPRVKQGESKATGKLGRDHQVRVDDAGLVTVLGGKWTTYRKMAEDCVDRCAELGRLAPAACKTASLPIVAPQSDDTTAFRHYGANAAAVRALIESDQALAERLDPELLYTVGEAVWAIRHEMARTVEDVLSRRLRVLLLDAAAAMRMAPRVAELIAAERGYDATWVADETERFNGVARGYLASASGERN